MNPRPLSRGLSGLAVQPEGPRRITRNLPEEVPVAIVFDGSTQAVMMATPADITDFALGFALSEGIIDSPAEVEDAEALEHGEGIEARLWLRADRSEALKARRRMMTGPVGCGLCGIDSLEQALRPLPRVAVTGPVLAQADVATATDALSRLQPLHSQTRATHAAGFLVAGQGIVMVREDVGRHNALDKLIGGLARAGIAPSTGAFVMTSRISVDLVQKCAQAGCPVLIAVAAPTAAALRHADAAGITLAAFARGGAFDLYSHPLRIDTGASHVA